jgi:hypothetical protein
MLKQAGVRTHPGLRIVIGVIIGALGWARGTTAPLIIGGVLVVWGLLAVLSLAVGAGGGRGSR